MRRHPVLALHLPDRPPGIPKRSAAPFWRGERAEAIVAARRETYLAKARRPRGTRSVGTKTPQQELRRLERALARRKTLAARLRIQQRIRQLKRENNAC